MGIILWEIMTRRRPFDLERMENPDDFVKKVQAGERPSGPQTEMREVMAECWDQDPKKRPSITALRDKLKARFDAAEDNSNNQGIDELRALADEDPSFTNSTATDSKIQPDLPNSVSGATRLPPILPKEPDVRAPAAPDADIGDNELMKTVRL
jgi:hypothetical protein